MADIRTVNIPPAVPKSAELAEAGALAEGGEGRDVR